MSSNNTGNNGNGNAPSDEDVEQMILGELHREAVNMWNHYKDSHGRVLKDSLQVLQDLVDLRQVDLDQWDPPAPGDTANIAVYAATRAFLAALRDIVDRMWASYRAKHSRVTATLIQELRDLVDARITAAQQE